MSRRVFLPVLALMCGLLLVPMACRARAGLEVRSLTVTPPQVDAGQQFIVTAEVCNLSGEAATYEAVLTVDGVETTRASVSIAGGASAGVTFTLTRNTPGTYELGLGGASTTLVVGDEQNPSAGEEPADEAPTPPREEDAEEQHEPEVVAGETVLEIHQRAWEQAATRSAIDNYYKFSLYSSRSLAVRYPEIYLQVDILWMDMASDYGGWGENYLLRDRESPGDEGWDDIFMAINDGFRKGKTSGTFDWAEDFNWEAHRENAVDLFEYYDGAECFEWLDNRMIFVWSAMKGLEWQMPFTSLAEIQFLQMQLEGRDVYLLLTEDRKGYVAELAGEGPILHDPLTGQPIEYLDRNVVLVMNNESVWYPLMQRDDRGAAPGLADVVERYCDERALPTLSEFEHGLIEDLVGGTALEDSEAFTWAKLAALRGLKQYTWRAGPLRELSATVFPERFSEDSDYSDSPQEQQCLGMVITELGNRLSPIVAGWAQVVQENSPDARKAFQKLGEAYLEQFHRIDSHSDWVHGDYYPCWLPNVDDKLVSGLGDCIVEAGNTMAALSLANIQEWQVYETNYWWLDGSGGHVICGAYTPDGGYSLSNGLFRTRDNCVRNGPLWDIDGRAAQEMIYSPEFGFIAFAQTKNAAEYSGFRTPFTNLSYNQSLSFLEDLEGLEPSMLIAEQYGGSTGTPIDDYIAGLPDMEADWPENVFEWTLPSTQEGIFSN